MGVGLNFSMPAPSLFNGSSHPCTLPRSLLLKKLSLLRTERIRVFFAVLLLSMVSSQTCSPYIFSDRRFVQSDCADVIPTLQNLRLPYRYFSWENLWKNWKLVSTASVWLPTWKVFTATTAWGVDGQSTSHLRLYMQAEREHAPLSPANTTCPQGWSAVSSIQSRLGVSYENTISDDLHTEFHSDLTEPIPLNFPLSNI